MTEWIAIRIVSIPVDGYPLDGHHKVGLGAVMETLATPI